MFDAVFDLDGTLVDSAVQCAAILSAMRADRGDPAPVDLAQTRACSSLGGSQLVATLLGPLARDARADLIEFRERYAETRTSPNTLYPGARAALEALAASGVRLTICSAKPQQLCEKVVADTGLTPLFANILGSAPDRACKPDPQHLFDTLGPLRRNHAICYIGDSEVDHAFAANAGVPLVLVEHGYAAAGYDFGSTVRAASFREVPALVMRSLLVGGRRPTPRRILPLRRAA